MIKKIKEIIQEATEMVTQVQVINEKGYIVKVYAQWAHGEDFIKQAKDYCKENKLDFKIISQ